MCKLTNIMNKLNDSQNMQVYHGTDLIYNGIASQLYKHINEKYFDMEIQTIESCNNTLVIIFQYVG